MNQQEARQRVGELVDEALHMARNREEVERIGLYLNGLAPYPLAHRRGLRDLRTRIRQIEVRHMIGLGLSQREIADRLNISPKTMHYYTRRRA